MSLPLHYQDLDEVLHLVHDTSLVVSQAMVACAGQYGEKPILWHMKRWHEPDHMERESAVCIHELKATFDALNHTCYEMVVDIDACSKDHRDKELKGIVKPGHCKMHLEVALYYRYLSCTLLYILPWALQATAAELEDAEIDIDHAIQECQTEQEGHLDITDEEIKEIAEHLHPELVKKDVNEDL